MSNTSLAILASVLGGLVTSVVVLVFARIWERVLVPWFESVVYKGAQIDGVWKTEMTIQGQTKHEVVILHQRAHTIWGTMTYADDTQGHSHTYELRGVFFDNVLTALSEELGKARWDRGALVLALQPGHSCSVMKGVGVWFDGLRPAAAEYIWVHERN
jgi:hypothetical protein